MHVAAHNRLINLVATYQARAGYHTTYQCDNTRPVHSSDTLRLRPRRSGTTAIRRHEPTTIPLQLTSRHEMGQLGRGYLSCPTATPTAFATARAAAQETQRARRVRPPTAIPRSRRSRSRHDLPASFYLSAKPAWFGSVPCPPIGPDVTCSANCVSTSGNHANKIPARVCYESSSKDSNGNLTAY